MKFIFKLTALVVFLSTSMTVKGMADVPGLAEPTIVFEVKENVKSMVFVLNSPSNEAVIELANSKGQVLFAEDMAKKTNYSKRFNLENLSKGEYSLKTENSIRAIVYTILVEEGSARLINKKVVQKPIFRKKGDKVYVHILNPEGKKINIDVYNGNGEIVQEERVKNETGVTKVFNFANAAEDTYSIRVWDTNGIYFESFDVE